MNFNVGLVYCGSIRKIDDNVLYLGCRLIICSFVCNMFVVDDRLFVIYILVLLVFIMVVVNISGLLSFFIVFGGVFFLVWVS